VIQNTVISKQEKSSYEYEKNSFILSLFKLKCDARDCANNARLV